MKLYERIENNNFDEIDKNRAIELIEGGNGHLVYNENYFKLQKENENLSRENRKLRTIRYDTAYGVESIYLITKRDLVEINTNKYFIEIQDGKFVDLKQVYQENEKLNEYKENYIPVEKVKDKIEEILNNKEYRIVFEGNAEFPDDATIINAQKYIKLEKMQELIEEREEK